MPSVAFAKPYKLDDILRRSDKVFTLPHVALRVMQVANDEKMSVADLKVVLEGDAPLSARILRCVNSSAYALRSRVANLQLAITYLGCKQVRNLAIAGSVHDKFAASEQIGSYNRPQLWRHLVSVGICARLLAMRLRLPNFEDAFLAGLLHDIGIIPEDQLCHDGFVQVMQNVTETRTLAEVEREILGFDHMTLGEKFAASWKMPDALRVAIRHHHNSLAYHGPESTIVQCVEVANMVCTMQGLSSIGINALAPSRDLIGTLDLTKDDLILLAGDTDRELQQHTHLFTM